MVCVRTGRPASHMKRVYASEVPVWPWLFFPSILFVVLGGLFKPRQVAGLLPYAEHESGGISATYERSIGVILKGVHPSFADANRTAQRKS